MAEKQKPKTVRLRNTNSGAVVEVLEDKVARLGSEWEAAPAKASAAKKSAASEK